jgi:hypothetical protein
MKTVKLEIKAANKITSFLNILGWTAFILGLILFLVLDKSIQYWGLYISLPFVVSLLVFLLLYLAFPVRKVGEVKLDKKKILIDKGEKPKSLSYSDISKISLLLYPSAKRFHRDWWPITDDPIAYEPSSKNYLIVKPKKGKPINIPVFLGSKRVEEKLFNIVQKNCSKYKIGLRIK